MTTATTSSLTPTRTASTRAGVFVPRHSTRVSTTTTPAAMRLGEVGLGLLEHSQAGSSSPRVWSSRSAA